MHPLKRHVSQSLEFTDSEQTQCTERELTLVSPIPFVNVLVLTVNGAESWSEN